MKVLPALCVSVSMVVTPVAAQVAPYNPAMRAAPPTFKVVPPVPSAKDDDAAAKARRLTAAAIIIGLGWILYQVAKDRPDPADDRPQWVSKPKDTYIFLPKTAPNYEPPPPPAPAISPFYDTSKGIGG